MKPIVLGKLLYKGGLASVYECTWNKKPYVVKIEYVTQNGTLKHYNSSENEVDFSLRFGNKHPHQFMTLVHHYIDQQCDLQLDWDVHNPRMKQKLVKDYKSILNEHLCFYKVYEKMDVVLSNVLYTLTQQQIYSLLLQVSYAMRLMHKNNFIHGDLHVGNVAAIKTLQRGTVRLGSVSVPTYGYHWKLIDFGMTLHKSSLTTKTDKEKFQQESDESYHEGLFGVLNAYTNFDSFSGSFDQLVKVLRKTAEFDTVKSIQPKNKNVQVSLYMTLFPEKCIELFGGKMEKNALLPVADLIFFARHGMHSEATFYYLLQKVDT